MRSPLTLFITTLTLCFATALPAVASPIGSTYSMDFGVYSDADLTTDYQDNWHETGGSVVFDEGSLYTHDLLYLSGYEPDTGYTLVLNQTFTPDGSGGGVMHFNVDNSTYPGQPMFPGVGTSVDEAYLDIWFGIYSAPVLDVQYSIDGTPGVDALPALIIGEAPINLGLEWFGSSELAGAQSIQVDVTLGAAAVPEPTSLALVGSLTVGLFGLRRRLVV